MTIRARPVIIDGAGFQRRSWDFVYNKATYYIQESAGAYYTLKQIGDEWRPVDKDEAQQILAAFEAERGPDRSGLKD